MDDSHPGYITRLKKIKKIKITSPFISNKNICTNSTPKCLVGPKNVFFLGNLNIVHRLKEKSFGQKKMAPWLKFCHFSSKQFGKKLEKKIPSEKKNTTFSNFGEKNSPNFGFQYF
jgi:hypothetical protein